MTAEILTGDERPMVQEPGSFTQRGTAEQREELRRGAEDRAAEVFDAHP